MVCLWAIVFMPAAAHLLKVIPDTNVVNQPNTLSCRGPVVRRECFGKIKPKRFRLKYLDTKKVDFFADLLSQKQLR